MHSLVAILLLAGCEKDDNKIVPYDYESNHLIVAASNIVLRQEEAGKVVLSLTWTKSTLSVSNPEMNASDLESVYIRNRYN